MGSQPSWQGHQSVAWTPCALPEASGHLCSGWGTLHQPQTPAQQEQLGMGGMVWAAAGWLVVSSP